MARRTPGNLKVEKVAIKSLTIDPANLRMHPEANHDAIVASLKKFGQQKPIVVDADGIVLAGNGTLAAARELGWRSLYVARSELRGAEAVAYAIADNRTGELAEWDRPALASMLQQLQEEAGELPPGFGEEDLTGLLEALQAASGEEWSGSFVKTEKGEPEFVQRSFVLHRTQAAEVDRAIRRAKQLGEGTGPVNENANGNALAALVDFYLRETSSPDGDAEAA